MDSKTAQILAGQRATLMRLTAELDRLLDDSDTGRALTALESVSTAAGGVESYAWTARHEELQTAMAADPASLFRAQLTAAIDALPADDPELIEAINGRPAWTVAPGSDRRESIALRIATLQPANQAAIPALMTTVSSAPDMPALDTALPVWALDVHTGPEPIATVALAPRATESGIANSDPVTSAALSILSGLGAARANQAQTIPPQILVLQPDRTDLPTAVASAAPNSAHPAIETARDESVDWDIHPADSAHLKDDWDPDLDAEEAEVVVVQRQPLSTEKLEERLARMDRDAAGLVRPYQNGGSAPGGKPGATATRSKQRLLETPITVAAEPVAPTTDATTASGFEAQVEIVRRPAVPHTTNTPPTSGPMLGPATSQTGAIAEIEWPERRARPNRQDYPAEPAAAFVAGPEEASVEIVRPAQPTAWRPAFHRDLEPVPVNRFLKALNSG